MWLIGPVPVGPNSFLSWFSFIFVEHLEPKVAPFTDCTFITHSFHGRSLFLPRRAFHHYREVRDHKEPLKKHPELDRVLREEFRSVDDFRRARAKKPVPKEVSH